MQHFDIESANLKFKNLLSGPAPIGRILNYIYLIGTTGLFHINGYRETNLNQNIGYAWTTEFMIGLGIIELKEAVQDKFPIILTQKGKLLFNLMKDNYSKFSEGVKTKEIQKVREEMDTCNPELYKTFKETFTISYPFQVLREFLNKNGYSYVSKKDFMDDLFETTKTMYDSDTTPYNRNSRTTTGENRVPSILQLAELFNMLVYEQGELNFISRNINTTTNAVFREISNEDLLEIAKKEELIQRDANELIEQYGEDGNTIIEAITRHGTLQKMFKHNLMITQNKKCVLCGLKIPNLLIGSHIKPAASSNVSEKVNHNNGLLLCCNHDKLFDKYLITFNSEDGAIIFSKVLTEEDKNQLNLISNFKLDKSLLTEERKMFLKHHNNKFKEKEINR